MCAMAGQHLRCVPVNVTHWHSVHHELEASCLMHVIDAVLRVYH